MSSMPDALSSASLLLAALALVYSAWSASIDAQASYRYSADDETKSDEKKVTRKVRNARARPMMIACWLVFVLFIPRDFGLLCTTFHCAAGQGDGCRYDDVSAIFLLTQILVAGLALHMGGRVSELSKQLNA